MTVSTADELTGRPVRVLADVRTWILAGMYALVLTTNTDIASSPSGDSLAYREIASAAPHLPTEPIGSAYAGRFAAHYVVGLLSRLTGLSLDSTYLLAWIVVMAALFAVVLSMFRFLPVLDFALCAALFVFNPFTLRPYILQTESLQDLVFVVGLGITLLGLRRRGLFAVLSGLVIASLGRQTATAVALVAAFWILVDPTWKRADQARRRWAAALAAVGLEIVMYSGIKIWSSRFSTYYEPSLLHNSILGRIGDLPGAAPELAAHFARTAIPLALPVAALLPLIVIVGWRQLPFACWGGLITAAAIAAQPAMIDPAWVGFQSNEQRLAALCILPLTYSGAAALGRLRDCRHRTAVGILAVAVVVCASMHHEFSAFGPRTLGQFLGLQVTAAVGLAALITFGRRGMHSHVTDAGSIPK